MIKETTGQPFRAVRPFAFICIVVPMIFMVLILRRKARLIVGFMLIGIFVSLFVSELNTVLLRFFEGDYLYATTTIAPITEEIINAVPALFYALVFSDDRETIMPIAFSIGIGFALFENLVILVKNIETVTIGWAIIRGFSTYSNTDTTNTIRQTTRDRAPPAAEASGFIVISSLPRIPSIRPA